MSKTVLITGATGFLGKRLSRVLIDSGYTPVSLSRSPEKARAALPEVDRHVRWTGNLNKELEEVVDGSAAVVNLAGESVGSGRWTDRRKRLILESRVRTTEAIVGAIRRASNPPRVLVSASGIGYYGDSGADLRIEESPAGSDFLAQVCVQWERTALRASEVCRVVCPRIGIVLAAQEGALAKMLPMFRLGIGGPLGTGRQWFSWIHCDDLIGAVKWSLENQNISGAINCVAPNPVTMSDFAHQLGAALHRPSIMRVPEFVLKAVLGEQHIIVTGGQQVSAEKLRTSGFKYVYPTLSSALPSLTSP